MPITFPRHKWININKPRVKSDEGPWSQAFKGNMTQYENRNKFCTRNVPEDEIHFYSSVPHFPPPE